MSHTDAQYSFEEIAPRDSSGIVLPELSQETKKVLAEPTQETKIKLPELAQETEKALPELGQE